MTIISALTSFSSVSSSSKSSLNSKSAQLSMTSNKIACGSCDSGNGPIFYPGTAAAIDIDLQVNIDLSIVGTLLGGGSCGCN